MSPAQTTVPRTADALEFGGLRNYRFLQALQTLPFVDALILYGSRARGDHRKRSDIDLAIIAPQASREQWRQVMDIIDNADTLLTIDCVRLDSLPANDPLRANIQRDGVQLSRKQNA